MADSQYQDEHSNLNFPEEMTVKVWFDYWISMRKRIALYDMLDYAYQNDVIMKNPFNGMVKFDIGKPSRKKEALTLDQQRKFVKGIERNAYENQYKFLLQTGLRTGELVGLKWADIDFANRTMMINRSMEYRYSVGEWRVGEPKSKSGYRTIP
mgnify:CR=1 FL=1